MSVQMGVAYGPGGEEQAMRGAPAWYAGGRLRDTGVAAGVRTYAMWTHLSVGLAFFVAGPFAIFAPLVLWLARRERAPYVDDHGREVVNFSITGVIACFIPIVGLIWLIVGAINVVRGAVAAHRGEYFRYPLTFRFLS